MNVALSQHLASYDPSTRLQAPWEPIGAYCVTWFLFWKSRRLKRKDVLPPTLCSLLHIVFTNSPFLPDTQNQMFTHVTDPGTFSHSLTEYKAVITVQSNNPLSKQRPIWSGKDLNLTTLNELFVVFPASSNITGNDYMLPNRIETCGMKGLISITVENRKI